MKQENELEERMDYHMEIANEFKNQLIPLAFEYYLGLIEKEDKNSNDSQGSDSTHDRW